MKCKHCGHEIEEHNKNRCTHQETGWLVLVLRFGLGLGLGIGIGIGLKQCDVL